MLLALVNANVVVDIREVVQDSEEHLRLAREFESAIDITEIFPRPMIGWKLEGNKLVGEEFDLSTDITRFAFRNRFTFEELVTMQVAAESSPELAVLLENLRVSESIKLSDSETIMGVFYLAQAGLITEERATEIVTTPPKAHEVHR